MTLDVQGRKLHVPRQAMGVARFTFEELCTQPLGAADYLAIARHYHTVLIDHVPKMAHGPAHLGGAFRHADRCALRRPDETGDVGGARSPTIFIPRATAHSNSSAPPAACTRCARPTISPPSASTTWRRAARKMTRRSTILSCSASPTRSASTSRAPRRGARGVRAMWTEIEDGDPFHQCVLAHYMADAQDDPAEELKWDRRASTLRTASCKERPDAAGLTVLSLYPSLHLNLADVLHRTGECSRRASSTVQRSCGQMIRQRRLRLAGRLSRIGGGLILRQAAKTQATQRAIRAFVGQRPRRDHMRAAALSAYRMSLGPMPHNIPRLLRILRQPLQPRARRGECVRGPRQPLLAQIHRRGT